VKEGNDVTKMGVIHNYSWTTNQILFPAILLLAICVCACKREREREREKEREKEKEGENRTVESISR